MAGIEVADIFRDHGAAWRAANAGHASLGQLKVMAAIEDCRTAALGGHVEACEDCGHRRIAYNSCRNRHCPKCQGAAAKDWLAAREADLLPVGYFHLVFTLPAELAGIAWQNKAVVYDLLFRAASETLLTIAADPRHLGARIGITAVLHTWGSAMTHHAHVHMIVPGGGIALDRSRWIACLPASAGPLQAVPPADAGQAQPGPCGRAARVPQRARGPARPRRLRRSPRAAAQEELVRLRQATLRRAAGPARLPRPLHPPVAIANSRLLACDERGVTFRYKDYRHDGGERYRTMTLATDEFIRRFLLHVLPKGFHRIRHYGLLATAACKANVARARELIAAPEPPAEGDDVADAAAVPDHRSPCSCCGGRMIIVEIFERGCCPRAPPEDGIRPS